ncbi:hypothetical protein U1Q18_019282 [Sarracenia purpurea var. burkii]
MRKDGKQWLKPGDLSEYEGKRIRRIKENNDALNSLRLKAMATSVMGSIQPKHATEKGKCVRVTNMPPGCHPLLNGKISSSTEIGTQHVPPYEVDVEAQADFAASESIGKIGINF